MSQSTGGAAGKETTMGYGRCVGREGALAIATRMTVSIGVAAMVVMATVLPAPVSPASPTVKLSADRSRPGHQLRRGDDARGVVAPHRAPAPPRDRARAPLRRV